MADYASRGPGGMDTLDGWEIIRKNVGAYPPELLLNPLREVGVL